MLFILRYDACAVTWLHLMRIWILPPISILTNVTPSNEYEQTNLSKVAIKTAVELGMDFLTLTMRK